MIAQDSELTAMEALFPELEARGYDVFVHPPRDVTPAFLGKYVPDAVALRTTANSRRDKNIAIEVMREGGKPEKKLEDIVKLFEGQEDWELRVVWLVPISPGETVPVPTSSEIEGRLLEIDRLVADGHHNAGLLLAWAVFEALGRTLQSTQFQRPQTSGRLVQTLAESGHLTPDEADDVRALATKRNALAHGNLQVNVTRDDMKRFSEVLSTLRSLVPA
jgi:REase_AHJR-like